MEETDPNEDGLTKDKSITSTLSGCGPMNIGMFFQKKRNHITERRVQRAMLLVLDAY